MSEKVGLAGAERRELGWEMQTQREYGWGKLWQIGKRWEKIEEDEWIMGERGKRR